ncbi:MAG TPA: transcription-repair coupling factor [Anaerolineales bacterium]|nr:transcription-repair coupling factor [Anaerolineales bacterium]
MPDSILKAIRASAEFQRLVGQLQDFGDPGSFGLPRAARLPVLACLRAEFGVPMLLVVERADQALTLFDELGFWLDPAVERYFFPEPAPLFYEEMAWSENVRRGRLETLSALAALQIPGARPAGTSAGGETLSRLEDRKRIWASIRGGDGGQTGVVIVASLRALMVRTLPRRDFVRHTRNLKAGRQIRPAELAGEWVRAGYEHTGIVVQPGQFNLRGGLADIWPPAHPYPVRVEFFGDEVDSLRTFDPATQRTIEKVEQVLVTPAREFIRPADEETGHPLSEFHIPALHPQASLIDYLPDESLILLDDREGIEAASNEIETQAIELRTEKTADGLLAEDFPRPFSSWSELYDSAAYRRLIQLGPVDSLAGSDLARGFTPNPRFAGRIAAVLDHLRATAYRGDHSLVVSNQFARLEELWSKDRPAGGYPAPRFLQGSLGEGFTYSPPGANPIHLLTDGEIFGWRRPQVRRRAETLFGSPETAFADLQVGDWVVHIDHGIGRFMGLVQRLMEGHEREFLEVEYDDGDQLFVPVHQADRLTRYVGPDGRDPQPSKLGAQAWKTAREKVREAVAEVAQDLLELYALRSRVEGHAFSADSEWQRELETSFPYAETEDQLQALAEIKEDMERPRPMDRLICGDVGYGKTEVALRAAFKAVYDGKQVAMLVPTTVLAQQHFHTFRERMAAFPVSIEMLSRFRTDSEQREILFRLAMGEIDILIGTHRLLSGDVEVKDLGLLIIDEEQRFGVTHKEKLKQMRTEVDVLTLTATPIPRTMYMALTGVRDISTINTPPEERLPIITHVGPYSQKQVRRAILRELERGGQVFFVHNRVQTIYGMQTHLENLVPEAKIAVAHGQMAEQLLSRRMEAFGAGEIDILLSTSIIESGLDIPNANTLIVDRADMFGLAQLYQLRGRVGRASNQAYAYFFKHRKKPPTPEGRARLETLAENTQLGAGMNIAMRDLEIRGAGDLLGTRQSGHIAAVGFHLYTRMLAEAVRETRGEGQGSTTLVPAPAAPLLADLAEVYALRPSVNVDLPLPATIPANYVSDRDIRLGLYRRIAGLRGADAIETIRLELADRFGPLPDEVTALLYQVRVRLLAEKAKIDSIYPEGKFLVMRLSRPLAEDLRSNALGSDIRTGKQTLRLAMDAAGRWRDRLPEVLEALAKPELVENFTFS